MTSQTQAMRVPLAGRSTFAVLALIFVIAVGLRLGIRLIAGTEGYWASGYSMYAALADGLLAGDGYAFPGGEPTAFRVPLYPLFVAFARAVGPGPWPLLIAQACVSAGLAIVTGLIAMRLFGKPAGLVAALCCAVYPYYVWHDLALQESGLFAFLSALATLLLLAARDTGRWPEAAGAGFVLGLALLTRAVLLPFAMLAIVWLALPGHHGRHRAHRMGLCIVAAGALFLTLGPWLAYQAGVTGRPGLGTETGLSLYRGASPLLFSHFPDANVDESLRLIDRSMPADQLAQVAELAKDPAAQSAWYMRQAAATALADPAGYFWRALRKLAVAFGPLFSPRHGWLFDLGYALWWVPLLGLGLAGYWRDRDHARRNLLFAAHFAGFSAVTALIWAQTSHRSYLDVYLMVFAAPVALAILRAVGERLGLMRGRAL